MYIYQAFLLLFHKALLPPSSLSFCGTPSRFLSLWVGDVDVFFLQSKVAVRHTHYPVNPSSDHFHNDALVPPSDHCRTETVLRPETLAPSGDHCFTGTGPSSDHYCIDILVPSSDHYCTKKVAPPSDHLHTKRT